MDAISVEQMEPTRESMPPDVDGLYGAEALLEDGIQDDYDAWIAAGQARLLAAQLRRTNRPCATEYVPVR